MIDDHDMRACGRKHDFNATGLLTSGCEVITVSYFLLSYFNISVFIIHLAINFDSSHRTECVSDRCRTTKIMHVLR